MLINEFVNEIPTVLLWLMHCIVHNMYCHSNSISIEHHNIFRRKINKLGFITIFDGIVNEVHLCTRASTPHMHQFN